MAPLILASKTVVCPIRPTLGDDDDDDDEEEECDDSFCMRIFVMLHMNWVLLRKFEIKTWKINKCAPEVARQGDDVERYVKRASRTKSEPIQKMNFIWIICSMMHLIKFAWCFLHKKYNLDIFEFKIH